MCVDIAENGRKCQGRAPGSGDIWRERWRTTREVFGYEVTESGFHKMLSETAKEEPDFDEAVERFNGELGAEARAILRGLCVARK